MCKTNRSGKSICLSQTQKETLVSNLPLKYGLLAELLYYSAGRVKEITTTRVRNLNFKEGMITLEKSSTKTKETRQVPIHPRVMDDLNQWIKTKGLKEDDFVFYTESKNTKFRAGEKPVSTQSVDQFFRKAFDWNGITGASTHSFRRSRLTHLLRKGWNLREIMDISGHKNLVSLQQYLDSDKKESFEKYRQMFDEE
jgi:integrase/recombinase XerD